MDNADLVKRLEKALDHLDDIHTDHKYDIRNKNEAIIQIVNVIQDIKKGIDDGR